MDSINLEITTERCGNELIPFRQYLSNGTTLRDLVEFAIEDLSNSQISEFNLSDIKYIKCSHPSSLCRSWGSYLLDDTKPIKYLNLNNDGDNNDSCCEC